MLGSTWSEAFQRGGQDGKEATHSGADHHCTAGGRGRSGPRQIREADQPGASRTHDGCALKLLTVLDEHTRECLAIVVARKIRSHDVLEVLADLFVRHGPPEYLRSDNGPECRSKAGWTNARCSGRGGRCRPSRLRDPLRSADRRGGRSHRPDPECRLHLLVGRVWPLEHGWPGSLPGGRESVGVRGGRDGLPPGGAASESTAAPSALRYGPFSQIMAPALDFQPRCGRRFVSARRPGNVTPGCPELGFAGTTTRRRS